MPIPQNPDPLLSVIGVSADVLPIPETTSTDPTKAGALTYAQGWPAITALPPSAGGLAPQREYFNAVNKLLSQHVFFQQSGCVYPWMGADEETGFPGLNYLKGSHVLGGDGEEYVALQPSGPDILVSDGYVGPVDPTGETGAEYWRAMNSGGTESGGVPIGSIVSFSGTFGGENYRYPIPLGASEPDVNWVICDGITTNGLTVPDLRGRMLMGASATHAPGSAGGSETHTHAIYSQVGSTTLSVTQMPSHSHAISPEVRTSSGPVTFSSSGGGGDMGFVAETLYAGGSQPHTHFLDVLTETASSLPPYYVFAYIMRVA